MQSAYEHTSTKTPQNTVSSQNTNTIISKSKSLAPKPRTNKTTTVNSIEKNTNLLENIKKLLGLPDKIAEKQLLLLIKGIVAGLKDASVQTVKDLIKFLSHPINNTKNILEVISNPEEIVQLGKALVAEFHAKIQHIKNYLVNGDKDDNTIIQLGKDLGEVIWEVATTLVGAGATMHIAKSGVKLTKTVVKESEVAKESILAKIADHKLTKHTITRMKERNVSEKSVEDALTNPLKTNPIKIDELGRPSQRYIGKEAEVVINPKTGDIVSVNPTSSRKAIKLKGQNQ